MNDLLVNKGERQHLLNIFPEEIWLMTSDLLSACELEKISNSSSFLRMIFSSKRTTFLFPKVWKILGARFEDVEYDPFDESGDANFDKTARICDNCELERFVKPYSDILGLRLVCLMWNQVVDNFYEESQNILTEDFANWGYPGNHWTRYEVNGHERKKAVHIIRHFKPTHGFNLHENERCPFLCRSIILRIIADYSRDEKASYVPFYIDAAVTGYGCLLRHCCIRGDVQFQSGGDAYRKVELWAAFMPNLVTLELNITTHRFGILGIQDDFHKTDIEPLSPIGEAIRFNPFPVLKSLEYIKVVNCPPTLLHHILGRNCHITRMEIQTTCINPGVFAVQLPNLKELAITTIYSKSIFNQLASQLVSCPLAKLYLELAADRSGSLEWIQVATVLKQWSATLIDLKLMLPFYTQIKNVDTDNKMFLLNLPNIRFLRLTLPVNFILEYLYPMREKLEFLQVTMLRYSEALGKEKLMRLCQLPTYNNSARHKSSLRNLWMIFPKLKSIGYSNTFHRTGKSETWLLHRGSSSLDTVPTYI